MQCVVVNFPSSTRDSTLSSGWASGSSVLLLIWRMLKQLLRAHEVVCVGTLSTGLILFWLHSHYKQVGKRWWNQQLLFPLIWFKAQMPHMPTCCHGNSAKCKHNKDSSAAYDSSSLFFLMTFARFVNLIEEVCIGWAPSDDPRRQFKDTPSTSTSRFHTVTDCFLAHFEK